MRYSNIKNSIANAISRFSARVNAMLVRTVTDVQRQWHLQPFALPVSNRHLGTECLFRALSVVGASGTGAELPGVYLPANSQPCEITGKMVHKPSFQRLS